MAKFPGRLIGMLAAIPFAALGSETAQTEPASLTSCRYCHVVAARQAAPVLQPRGPDFSAIAADPRNTAERLRDFLATTHQNFSGLGMPNQLLSAGQIDELVRFILEQRNQPPSKPEND